jgi:hypothetical protein
MYLEGLSVIRIAEDLRKAVVFLGDDITDTSGRPTVNPPRATGFFVGWRSDAGFPFPAADDEVGLAYLVTARHVAEALSGNFLIRFNSKNGGASDIQVVENAKWIFHPDETVDVAITNCGYPAWADCVPVPGHFLIKPGEYMESGDPLRNERNMGVGDITYVVGLFRVLFGKKRNLPVVHTGHIALLPEDERIPVIDSSTGRTIEVEGYLIEAHALDGLSGAPVFARTSEPIRAEFRPETKLDIGVRRQIPGRMHGLTVLIGLWQSSWEGYPSERLMEARPSAALGRIPVGFGLVVPAYKIAETLNQPEAVEERKKIYKKDFSKL